MTEFIKNMIERLEEEKAKGFYDSDAVVGEKNIWSKAIDIVNQLAEEYNNGWIPMSEKNPENGQFVIASIQQTREINGGHPIVIMEFREDNEPLFIRFVKAWQPLPAPYQPKGE